MTESALQSGAMDDGFHEAVAIVLNLTSSTERLCGALGYQTLWRGAASASALALMGVDPTLGGEEALIGDPDQGRGYIRLFQIGGPARAVMRDGAQPWDTGGVYDINIRALSSIEAMHAAFSRSGFCAFAPIAAFDFGGLSVREIVEHDADGLAIALMERVSPPLTGFETVKAPASFVFNSTQMVKSLKAAQAFYEGALGWTLVHGADWAHPEGFNVLGLPLDVARTRMLQVRVFQAKGLMRGSVEVIEVDGEGLDFSHAAPPERGWAALRFPMSDVEDFVNRAARGGCQVLAPREVEMQPYGWMRAAAAVTPWGARLEAYHPL